MWVDSGVFLTIIPITYPRLCKGGSYVAVANY